MSSAGELAPGQANPLAADGAVRSSLVREQAARQAGPSKDADGLPEPEQESIFDEERERSRRQRGRDREEHEEDPDHEGAEGEQDPDDSGSGESEREDLDEEQFADEEDEDVDGIPEPEPRREERVLESAFLRTPVRAQTLPSTKPESSWEAPDETDLGQALETAETLRGWAACLARQRRQISSEGRRTRDGLPGEGFFVSVVPATQAPWLGPSLWPLALTTQPLIRTRRQVEERDRSLFVRRGSDKTRPEPSLPDEVPLFFPALVWTDYPSLTGLTTRATRFASWAIGSLLKKQRKGLRELSEEEVFHHLLALLALGGDFTFNHSRRVMTLSLNLCQEMGVTDPGVLKQVKLAALFKDLGEIGFLCYRETSRYRERAARFLNSHDLNLAGVLHDMGKLKIPAEILYKPGKLSDEEFALMKMHPVYSEQILYPFLPLRHLCPAVRGHHERWDGKGYPDGLAGENIPLAARVIALSDVFDALLADRPYRKGMPFEKVVAIIREGSGSHFDPSLVPGFLRAAEKAVLEQGLYS